MERRRIIPSKGQAAQRLRAASALAKFDPDGEGWTAFSPLLAEQLVNENPFFSRIWNENFRPIKSKLFSSLANIYRDRNRSETERTVATNLLGDYAADQPELLADLLMDSDKKQFASFYPIFKERSDRGASVLEREVELSIQETSDDQKERMSSRQAYAAVALVRINRSAKVWPLLKHSDDPRVRSYLIHRFFPLGGDPKELIGRWQIEPDMTIRRALILSLGEFDEQTLTLETRVKLIPKLRDIFRADADSGLHAAAEWLLRQWKDEAWLKETIDEWVRNQEQRELRFENIRDSLTGSEQKKSHDWYVNGQGQTLIVIPGPTEFMMGSARGRRRAHQQRTSAQTSDQSVFRDRDNAGDHGTISETRC